MVFTRDNRGGGGGEGDGGKGGGGGKEARRMKWGVSVLQAISVTHGKGGDAAILLYWWDGVLGFTGDLNRSRSWLSSHLLPDVTSEHVLNCTFACTQQGCEDWCRTLQTPAADNPGCGQ